MDEIIDKVVKDTLDLGIIMMETDIKAEPATAKPFPNHMFHPPFKLQHFKQQHFHRQNFRFGRR